MKYLIFLLLFLISCNKTGEVELNSPSFGLFTCQQHYLIHCGYLLKDCTMAKGKKIKEIKCVTNLIILNEE